MIYAKMNNNQQQRRRRGTSAPRISAGLALLAIASVSVAGILPARAQTAKTTLEVISPVTIPGGIHAMPGQVIIRVPASYSSSDVASLANAAGCNVLAKLPYSNQYYVLQTKVAAASAPTATAAQVPASLTSARTGGAVTRAANSRAIASPTIPSTAFAVTADVTAAVTALNQTAGVNASPNYLRHLTGSARRATTANVAPVVTLPNDPYFAPGNTLGAQQRWNYGQINMPAAWVIQSNTIGRTVKVADIDTGIDFNHPDLQGHILPGGLDFAQYNDATTYPNPVPTPLQGDMDQTDGGHGTMCGGIMIADTNNDVGVSSVAGWNSNGVDVQLLPMNVFSVYTDTTTTPATVYESASDASLIAAVNFCVQQKMDVVNMSLGGPDVSATTPFHDAITAAYNAGVILVAADGNDAVNLSSTTAITSFYGSGVIGFYPAEFPEVIAVSALDQTKTLATYSNYGGNVAISAPGGSGNFSTFYTDPSQYILSTVPLAYGAYGYGSGTSFAAPHVAAAAALAIGAGGPTDPASMKALIQSTAQQLSETPNNNGGNKYGAGELNVYGMLRSLNSTTSNFTAQFTEIVNELYTIDTSANNTLQDFSQTLNVPYANVGNEYTPSQEMLHISYVSGAVPTMSEATANALVVTISFLGSPTTPSTTSLPQTVATYTGTLSTSPPANSFTISASGASPSDTVEADIPTGSTLAGLQAGSYSATLTNNGTVVGVVFFNLEKQTLNKGRSMFATPFLTTGKTSPEQLLIGSATSPNSPLDFQLYRYNSQQSSASPETYFEFNNSGTPDEPAAGLSSTQTAADGLPISFIQGNPSSSIAPVGLGFWLDLPSSATLTPTGETVAGPVAVRLFYTPGSNGWNMIGDPYTYSVPWGSVSVLVGSKIYTLTDAISANIISSTLVGYRNDPSYTDYLYYQAPAGTLDPFNGYWVQVNQDCTLIIPPISTASSRAVSATRSQATTIVPVNGWQAQLKASVAGDIDSQNYFGETANAKTLANRFDVLKPPSGSGHAYLRFVKTAQSGRSEPFAYDMRPTSSGHQQQWTATFTTDRAHANVTLTWAGIGAAPTGADFTLTDNATGVKTSLRGRSSYTFQSGEAGSTRSFTITETARLSAGPLAIQNVSVMGGTRSASVPGVTLHLSTTREADVLAVVKTLSGKQVGTFAGDSRSVSVSGTTLHWTGKNDNGASLAAGPYMIEITARDANGETATVRQVYMSLR